MRFRRNLVFVSRVVLTGVLLLGSLWLGGGTAHASVPYEPDELGETYGYATSRAIDYKYHRAFTAEFDNARILVYALDSQNRPISNTPINVLGRPNYNIEFTPENMLPNSDDWLMPIDVVYDQSKNYLYASDSYHHRVLVYNVTTVTDGMPAFAELGQPDMHSMNQVASRTGLYNPGGLGLDTRRHLLIVADGTANRVMIFNISTIVNGEPAVNILGQANWTDTTPQTTQTGLDFPNDLGYDSVRRLLFQGEEHNNRIKVYDLNVITNNEPAINVIGQPDFTSSTEGDGKNGFKNYYVGYDEVSKLLYIDDYFKNRILIFDTTSLSNYPDAIGVLGQPDFNTYTPGSDDDQLNGGGYVQPDSFNKYLYVGDKNNRRILLFKFVKFDSSSIPTGGKVGRAFKGQLKSINSQGALSYSIQSGSLPPGLNLDSLTGAITGTPTTTGTYKLTFRVSDDNNPIGIFTDFLARSIVIKL